MILGVYLTQSLLRKWIETIVNRALPKDKKTAKNMRNHFKEVGETWKTPILPEIVELLDLTKKEPLFREYEEKSKNKKNHLMMTSIMCRLYFEYFGEQEYSDLIEIPLDIINKCIDSTLKAIKIESENDVKEVLARIDKITTEKNKPLGFHVISSDHTKTLEKIKSNYKFVAFSLDFFFLGDKAREEMQQLKDKLK